MSFTPFNLTEIAAGQPTKQDLFTKLKNDFDDHESRLAVAEAAVGKLPPIPFDVIGTLNAPLALTEAMIYRVASNITVTAARLLVKTAGTSGTVQANIEYKRGAGAWTSILTADIAAAYTLGNYAVVSGTLAVQSFLVGDLFRLNINAVQNLMTDFSVYLENSSA